MAKAELTTVENFKIVTGMETMVAASMESTSRSRLAEEKPSRSRQTIRTIRRS